MTGEVETIDGGITCTSTGVEITNADFAALAFTVRGGIRPSPEELAARPEPSDLVKSSKHLMAIWNAGILPHGEIERRATRAVVFAEVYSVSPWHAERAAKDPDYWNILYESRVNW